MSNTKKLNAKDLEDLMSSSSQNIRSAKNNEVQAEESTRTHSHTIEDDMIPHKKDDVVSKTYRLPKNMADYLFKRSIELSSQNGTKVSEADVIRSIISDFIKRSGV